MIFFPFQIAYLYLYYEIFIIHLIAKIQNIFMHFSLSNKEISYACI